MLGIIDILGGSIVLIISSLIYGYILLKPQKLKIKIKEIAITILSIIIYCIIAKYTNGITKTIYLFCLHISLFKYIFKITYSDTMFLTFLYMVLIVIQDVILILFITISKSSQVFYAEYAGTIISTIIVNTTLLLTTYIFRKWLKKLIRPKINNNKKILLYTILTFGCILVIFYETFQNIKLDRKLIISIIIMIIFVVILYSLIKQKMENDKVVEKYDKLLEFIKKYEVIIEEQREARHESKNQLITIKSKVLNRDAEQEIIKYVDSLLKDHISYKEDKYGKFQYLPGNGIKGLFYYKAMEAEEKRINLSINIGEKVEKSIISKLETEEFKQLGRILGVYLDNAIEASSLSEEKKLGIEVYKHKSDVIMIISNTYEGEIEEENIGKIKYTTKGSEHGYGLILVNKILSKNKRFCAERQVTNKLYIQKLIIKKSIK